MADGKTVDTQTVEHGKDATLPEIPVKAGYDQVKPKWDHDGKNITADLTITAVYTKVDPDKVYHTVTFVADGKVIGTQTVEHGKDAKLPAVPAKSGYTGAWDHDGKNITADLTITAVYKVIPNEDVPETGDNNQIMLWSSLSLISLLVIVCLLLFGKKLLYKGEFDK